MNMTIQSTTKLVYLNGVPARVWEGVTEKGTPVTAFITRVAVPEDAGPEALAQFEIELEEHDPPSPAAEAWPARMIL